MTPPPPPFINSPGKDDNNRKSSAHSNEGRKKKPADFTDKREEAKSGRKLQEMANESPVVTAQQKLKELIHGKSENPSVESGPPIQRVVMDFETFRASTDFGEWRRAIKAIDTQLKKFHDPLERNKEAILTELLGEIDTYLGTKEVNDPTNQRVAPVKALRTQVLNDLYALKQVSDPDAPVAGYSLELVLLGRQDTDLNIAKALRYSRFPALADDFNYMITHSLNLARWATISQQQGNLVQLMGNPGILPYLLEGLSDANLLPAVLSDGLAQKYAYTLALTFPKGALNSRYQRNVWQTLSDLMNQVPQLKKIISFRYNIDEANIRAVPTGERTVNGLVTAQTQADWTVDALKRLYNAMATLPDGHASDNARFTRLTRFAATGSSGYFRPAANEVALGYKDGKVDKDYEGNDAFAGTNIFDSVVRHEVGHAVDAKLGNGSAHGSTGYCVGGANGGNWQFVRENDIAEEVFTATNGVFLAFMNGLDFQDHNQSIYQEIGTGFFHKGGQRGQLINTLNRYLNGDGRSATWTALNPGQKTARVAQLLADRGFQLVGYDFETPWKSAAGINYGGRTYVEYMARGKASYQTDTRARQVSNYQYRAPAEWWAEAYAAYYTPDADGAGHGARLQAVDGTTFTHFQTNVDQAL